MTIITPNFFTSSILAAVLLSSVIGLWERLSTRSAYSRSLFLRMTSKIASLSILLAMFILVTPCKNSIILSKPAVVRWLLHNFKPLILWMCLARCTYSTTESLSRKQLEMSKKSERVFLVNYQYSFQGYFALCVFCSQSADFSLKVLLFSNLGDILRVGIWDVGLLRASNGNFDSFGWLSKIEFFSHYLSVAVRCVVVSYRIGTFLRGVFSFILLLMTEKSASKVLLSMDSAISELQSIKGLTSDISSSNCFCIELSGMSSRFFKTKHFDSKSFASQSVTCSSTRFSSSLAMASWAFEASSSINANPQVTISRGPSQQDSKRSYTLGVRQRYRRAYRHDYSHLTTLALLFSNQTTAAISLKYDSMQEHVCSICFLASSLASQSSLKYLFHSDSTQVSNYYFLFKTLILICSQILNSWLSIMISFLDWMSINSFFFSPISLSKSYNLLKICSLWLPKRAQCGQILCLSVRQTMSMTTLCAGHSFSPVGSPSNWLSSSLSTGWVADGTSPISWRRVVLSGKCVISSFLRKAQQKPQMSIS